MPNVLAAVGRWQKFALCLAWLFTLTSLLASRGFEFFLSPIFAYPLGLAVLVIILFAAAVLAGRPTGRFGLEALVSLLLLLLPILHIWRANQQSLGGDAFAVRFVGNFTAGETPGGQDRELSRLTSSPVLPGTASPRQTGKRGGTAPSRGHAYNNPYRQDAREVAMSLLLQSPESYLGQKIKVVGMLNRENPDVAEILGLTQPLVFRFLVNCCSADAIPLAVLLDGGIDPSIPDNNWISASGVFALREREGYRLPWLDQAEVRLAEQPERVYLY
ncbi:MAG: hypothetical protein LBU79_03370 [Planctomycetota bacterium]|jgi:hypothetical protein|nr:hypothetical protein [Planctomycetota bacterium]